MPKKRKIFPKRKEISTKRKNFLRKKILNLFKRKVKERQKT
jgi:hypothetical protein